MAWEVFFLLTVIFLVTFLAIWRVKESYVLLGSLRIPEYINVISREIPPKKTKYWRGGSKYGRESDYSKFKQTRAIGQKSSDDEM
jgi:hypothetical protein